MTIKAVIFDLDGTLGDTLPVCFAAYRRVFREFLNRDFTDEEIAATFGPNEEGIFRAMVSDRWQAARERYLRVYEDVHTLCPDPFPGIEGALRLLKARGVRMGVVTGKGLKSTVFTLKQFGLLAYFDSIAPGDSARAIKPQSIRRLLAEWDVPMAQAAYVGDAPYDIEAAQEAGVMPLAAAWAPTTDLDSVQAARPQAVFHEVEDFMGWVRENVDSE
jgi:pyrophosphatase PpaX